MRLPYFDILLDRLEAGHPAFRTAFGRHVHWGYWATPPRTTSSFEEFHAAAERMTERVCDAAQVRGGERVLDVGCGLGGTLASLDRRFDRMELTGLNIDGRQLAYIRSELQPRAGNSLALQEGDACAMPFDDASFDVVLALECAFHFDSRERFLREVARVLRPGGRFALCDLVPAERATPFLFAQDVFFRRYVEKLVGPTDISWTRNRYVEAARAVGLRLDVDEDVTKNTIPTYRVLRAIAAAGGQHVMTARWGTGGMEWLARLGLLRYVILSFETPREHERTRSRPPRAVREGGAELAVARIECAPGDDGV